MDIYERERRLTSASEAYMRGKLNLKEFKRIEGECMPDYDAAFRALARDRRSVVEQVAAFCRRLRLSSSTSPAEE